MKNVMVTGGLGYIGAHLVDELVQRGHSAYVVDQNVKSPNLDYVSKRAIVRLCSLQDWEMDENPRRFDAIVHLAAYIDVAESTAKPLDYWNNNVSSLTAALQKFGTDHFIFASTGTAFDPANAYAYSKVAGEQIVQEAYEMAPSSIGGYTIFRYFNVSGLKKGINPTGVPTHLIRRSAMAASGKIPELTVMGTDWPTRDGTAIRDYIHVEDLAASIVNGIEHGPMNTPHEGLGSGSGSTVLEVVQSMKRVSGVDFRVTMAPRRSGDVASMVCQNQYPFIHLTRSLDDMCLSAYENV
jgi:UDP-glucose 4-epimerase